MKKTSSNHQIKQALISMRPLQWSKNMLVILPMLMAHKLSDIEAIKQTFFAFVSFSMCASAIYIWNDILDINSDRLHPTKRDRPIANGQFSLRHAFILAMILLGIGIWIGQSIGLPFLLVILMYALVTIAYSFFLKTVVILDVVLLSSFYTLRLYAGGIAANVVISKWLLMFSSFVFLSLALSKRFTELKRTEKESERRGYRKSDCGFLSNIGVVSGLVSVLVLALYVSSPQLSELYSNGGTLWFICPIFAYWIARFWLLTERLEINDDPIIFALRDPISYFCVLLFALVFGAAL